MSVFLQWTLPMPVVASPGSSLSLSSILAGDFGTSTPWSDYWLTYDPAAQLQAWDFSYWNLGNKLVGTWSVNGVDIGGGFNNQTHVSAIAIGTASFHVGNDIGPFAYITVPTSPSGAEYIQYSIITVDPHVLSPVAGHGAPTPQDIVDTAYRFANYYGSIFNDN